ncbi:MAG: adenosylcobinamide-GDP ribazoletransferase [Clostridiales bacterium]|jgi:adenosylcobinamide-GDP ribazoletransferase|nr:adenosylcobinamide-GDP ribazoletransferase [Clostridiales bacterium]
MKIMRAIGIAFSMYSILPMPRAEWDAKETRFSLCFLPLVGAVIGGVNYLWYLLCHTLGVNGVLFAAVFTCAPLLLTGGIHMDGFMDTVDALGARQDREQTLAIMKDPHAGAFAILGYGVYRLLYFGFSYTLYHTGAVAALCAGYVLSRAAAVCTAARLPNAREDGMLHAFTKDASGRATLCAGLAFALGAGGGMLLLAPSAGAGARVLCLFGLCWYVRLAQKKLGGVTGDTTGYFLQLFELLLLMGACIGSAMGGLP